ncbi:MAG: hypothetical protein ABUL62_19360 [Myxococcales bacterium]
MNEQVQTPRKSLRESNSGEDGCTLEKFSAEKRAALEAGLESARRGEIKPWGDFTKYANDDE